MYELVTGNWSNIQAYASALLTNTGVIYFVYFGVGAAMIGTAFRLVFKRGGFSTMSSDMLGRAHGAVSSLRGDDDA